MYVTGTSGGDIATVAYNAATGARLWSRRYSGPGTSTDVATSIAVSGPWHRVFVSGPSGSDIATVGYQG